MAKKLITNGLPSLPSVFVSIVFPFMSLSCTDGICATAVDANIANTRQKNIFVSFIVFRVRTYYQANIIFLGRFPKLGAIKTVFVVLFPPCFCIF